MLPLMTNREEEKTACPVNIKMLTEENVGATFLQISVEENKNGLKAMNWGQPVCSTWMWTAALYFPSAEETWLTLTTHLFHNP